MEILKLLRTARWLTTSQVHQRFFPKSSLAAARRRLRKLAGAGYVRKFQEDRMKEALFALAREGLRVLERGGLPAVILERKPPAQLEHFLAVNTIRIAGELAGTLSYFFAYWELPAAGWRHSLIPDAVFTLGDCRVAVEFDAGSEGIRFFMRTKIAGYRRGLPGFPVSAVLVVADREPRMEALARAVVDGGPTFLFTTIDDVRRRGLLAPIYRRSSGGTCSLKLFSREDTLVAPTPEDATTCKKFEEAS